MKVLRAQTHRAAERVPEGRKGRTVDGGVKVTVLKPTFKNISVISWRSVLLVEENRVPGKKLLLS